MNGDSFARSGGAASSGPLFFNHSILIAIFAIVTCCDVAEAQFRYRKVVDTSSAIPSGVGNFTGFWNVSYDGTNVAFVGLNGSTAAGVYLWDGTTVSAVASAGSTAPNGGGTFNDFFDLVLNAGKVAFSSDNSVKDGLYTTLGGSLRTVADQSTLVPGTSIAFSNFRSSEVAIDGTNVYFNAVGSNGQTAYEGVYRESSGVITKIVDRSNTIPNSSNNFIFFSSSDASGGNVVFGGGRGTGGGNGMYTTLGAPAGQVRTVMNTSTSLPGMTNPLSIYTPDDYRIDGSNLAFRASGANSTNGIYLERSGVVEVVANKNTVNPTSGTNFTSTGTYYALSGSNVAFTGHSGGPTGLFVKRSSGIAPVIHTSNTLDKKDLTSVTIYKEGLSGEKSAFQANFSDGTSGIFVAEPIDTTPGRQSVSLAPIFDAQAEGATVAGSSFGMMAQYYPPAGIDRRMIMEFNLSAVPAAATIKTIEVDAQVNILTSGTADAGSVALYGYAGDGSLSAADRLRTDVFLGESPMTFSLGEERFYLDPLAVTQARGAGQILGIVGLGDFEGDQLGFETREYSVAEAPHLIITYEPKLAGDFNFNGVVDASDYAVWRKGSNTIYTSADYNAWRTHFGQVLASGLDSAPSIPEPSCFHLAAVAMAFATKRRLR
jgi:hypothetical protein